MKFIQKEVRTNVAEQMECFTSGSYFTWPSGKDCMENIWKGEGPFRTNLGDWMNDLSVPGEGRPGC